MLTDRESQILSTLATLRFMTTQQIHRLHGYAGDYGLKVTRRLLGKLEREGLVHAWQPSRYEQKIYYLTRLGARTLAFCCGWDQVPTFRKSDKSVHQTYVSEIYVALKSWNGGPAWHFSLNQKYGDVVPDASVYFEKEDRPHVVFAEVDLGNESMLYLRDVKLERYARTFNRTSSAPERRSIVFLTPHENRKQALLRLISSYPLPVSAASFEELGMNPGLLLEGMPRQTP
ncbi:replication-relaxation family protein [Cohnella caldifontis]|uniref:replication-relaxation family protein n=1 Tax=Cohnella caldifontis TaxID=3027471 RepID=UPI0023EE19F1|nr:replication-relaxation family protein [Cohnella sp. YIM B05605]